MTVKRDSKSEPESAKQPGKPKLDRETLKDLDPGQAAEAVRAGAGKAPRTALCDPCTAKPSGCNS